MKALLLGAALSLCAAWTPPTRPAAGRVADFAGVLTPVGVMRLQGVSDELERRTSAELAVVTVKSLDGMSVEDYANRLFRAWGVGKKGKDNGVLILVCPAERRARVEVGYGLEPVLPDALAGRIARDDMAPQFALGDFEGGLETGARRVAELVVGGPVDGAPRVRRTALRVGGPKGRTDPGLVLFLALFVCLGGFMAGWGAMGGKGSSRLFGVVWGAGFGGIPLVMAAAAGGSFGFWVLAALGAACSAAGLAWGRKHKFKAATGSGSRGNWSSGGGGGGGGDIGGGSSGGGGASASW